MHVPLVYRYLGVTKTLVSHGLDIRTSAHHVTIGSGLRCELRNLLDASTDLRALYSGLVLLVHQIVARDG